MASRRPLVTVNGIQTEMPTGDFVPATSGGTGQIVYVVGDLLYASTTTALSRLAGVAVGNVLISGGVGVAFSWGKVALGSAVSGSLPVANGGTGSTTAGAALTALGAYAAANPSGYQTAAQVAVLISPTPRVITSGATATLVAADAVVVVRKTTGSATAITLEASPVAGTRHKIKDGKGDAATNNITIAPASGTIDGAVNFVISNNYAAYEVIYDGTEWGIH